MPELWNQTQDRRLLNDLSVANTMWTRTRGLLGTKTLGDDQALWILHCSSIHTFFMNYAIDCVFLDRSLKIKSVVTDIKPGRVVWPQWGASSVIEMPSGSARRFGLQVGDQLHVGH